MGSRFRAYCVLSFFAAIAAIAHAIHVRRQFYNVIIHLATSKISVTLLGNAGLVLVLLIAQVLRHLFLGPLRAAEMDRLYEKSWFAITETCLALTIFREEISMRFVLLLTFLLFNKVFHWLSQFRVEQFPTELNISVTTHTRIIALMSCLFLIDSAVLVWQVKTMMSEGPSILILFTFEYVLLASTMVTTFCKYAVYLIDVRRHGRWGGKAVVSFYLNLASDLFQLFVYLCFFAIVFSYYGLPLHIVRELYMTFGRFKKRIADFVRYRRIILNMNSKFPTATDEELQEVDCTCVVCRDEMVAESSKKLPCGHIFHFECLRAWLEGNTTCPTCRAPVEPDNQPDIAPQPRRQRPNPAAAERPNPAAAAASGAGSAAAPVTRSSERGENGEGEGQRQGSTGSNQSTRLAAAVERVPRTHAEAATLAADAAKKAATEAALAHIRQLTAAAPPQAPAPTPPLPLPSPSPSPRQRSDPPSPRPPSPRPPSPAHALPAPLSTETCSTPRRASSPLPPTPASAPAPAAPPPPNPPTAHVQSAEPPPPNPPVPGHMGYAAGVTPNRREGSTPAAKDSPRTPMRGTPMGRGGYAIGGTPRSASSQGGGGERGVGWSDAIPEVASLEPLRQGIGLELEVAAAELEVCLGRADAGAKAALETLILRLETLLLPMAKSQAAYMSTVLEGYKASPLSATNTPVRRLKLSHLLKTLECQQSEVGDLITMSKQHLETLQRGSVSRGAQV